MTAPPKALQNPPTSNPGTRKEVSLKSVALITKVKNPRVITVSGKVKSKKIGRIKALTKARIITAKIAEKNPLR